MARHSIYFLATNVLLNPVFAFTNGTLVPAYLCNAAADGMPKTFGQILALTRQQTPTVAFSGNPAQNVVAPPLVQQNTSQIGNAAFILASLHDSPNSIETQQNSLVITPANGDVIVAGQANAIRISTRDASQLKGAVVIGQDGSGRRQGSFTDAPGGPFIPFAGCGPNAQGDISGVIQQTGITAENSYSLLVYNAPACIPGNNITFGGLSVTGSGFGQYAQTFIVTGSTCGGATNGTIPIVEQPSTLPQSPVAGQPPAGGSLPGCQQPSIAPSGIPQIPGTPSVDAVVRTVTKVSETFTTVFVKT